MSSLEDFKVIDKLGSGTFSEVFKVIRNSDGQLYALKKVKMTPLSEKEQMNALNEVRILASVQHPCIVGYKEAFIEREKYLCIVMEFADGGDLFQKITRYSKSNRQFTEDKVWRILLGAVTGL